MGRGGPTEHNGCISGGCIIQYQNTRLRTPRRKGQPSHFVQWNRVFCPPSKTMVQSKHIIGSELQGRERMLFPRAGKQGDLDICEKPKEPGWLFPDRRTATNQVLKFQCHEINAGEWKDWPIFTVGPWRVGGLVVVSRASPREFTQPKGKSFEGHRREFTRPNRNNNEVAVLQIISWELYLLQGSFFLSWAILSK